MPQARAGGSGLNTLVIVNQLSPNSCELGNYYCERRQVPPENVVRISWSGGNLAWSTNDFQTNLLGPLLAALSSRQLTNQIDFLVLSMDIPILAYYGSGNNSTTSTLFYGLKDEQGPDYLSLYSSYAGSEQIFANARPATAQGFSFLATMITAPSLALAKRLVDQGVASDGTFPYQSVLLAKSSDSNRNIRYPLFDNTIFNTRLCRSYSVQRTNCDSFAGQTNILGFQIGISTVPVSPNAFVPGAMADDLTSWGGVIFGYNDQTSLMSFITNGASGGYGSINETAPVIEKFPSPQNYFYQARGYSIAECYYQSVSQPFQGLTVAEPLAAPFRRPGSGKWSAISSNSPLSQLSQLSLQLSAADSTRPLHQVDLFLDGKFFRTLTNLAPLPGNLLTVSLNGYPILFTNPPAASLASTVTNLCLALNAPAVSNITKVVALPFGDRIELHSTFSNNVPPPFYLTDGSASDAPRAYRVLLLPQSNLPALSPLGRRGDGAFQLHAETPSAAPLVIMASTNLFDWLPIYTNATGGPLDFVDLDAVALPNRFYRLSAAILDQRPRLSSPGKDSSGALKIHVDAATSTPYTLDASADLLHWAPLVTNLAGSSFDFLDAAAPSLPNRFYRAALVPPPPVATPRVSFIGAAPGGGSLLRVDGAAQAYVVQISSNLFTWTTLFTNLNPTLVKLSTRTDSGAASALTTYLNPSRDTFLPSIANGSRQWTFNGSIQIGSWLQMTVTRTNGSKVILSVTNQTFGATVGNIVTQMVNAVTASPDLKGLDGLSVQDVSPGVFSSTLVTFAARGAGQDAGGITLAFGGTPNIYKNPSRESALNQNLSDLQPRNHLYVTTGASSLKPTFTLDTTTLANGSHELIAVAYEGSHVHTQTRCVLPITVSNSPLSATLTLLDLSPTNSVSGAYHVQVSANTNSVTAIRLYTTGGLFASATNQPAAAFTIAASYLGAGLHQFYALVDTAAGPQFRTQPQWVRFQ